MPTTINGIGTGYYGKKNIEKFDGICEKCRRGVQLRNYETRLWFCVLYLPVIPLGRKQILNYCPSCTQHMAIEFAEWERIRQNEIDQSAAEMGQNKDNPTAAIKMHSTLVSFHKQDEAQRLAEIMLGKFGADANVQFYLGGWHERCGRGTLADECFAQALQLEPANPTFKRAVAIGQIEHGNLPRARQLLADLEPPSPNFDPSSFFLLAKAYQKEQDYAAAMEIFQIILSAAPQVAGEKPFRVAVRQSEKALGQTSSVVPHDPFYRSKAFWGSVAALLLVAGLCWWNSEIGRNRTLHVVNSLTSPIVVRIDGREIPVPEGGRTPVTLAEGPHEAAVINPAGMEQPIQFSMSAGWFQRFLSQPAFVLNPTLSAAVIWEETTYSNLPRDVENKHEIHVGQAFVTYPHVDYAFVEFPAQLKVKNTSRNVTKTRIDVIRHPPEELAAFLSLSRQPEELLPFLEANLRTRPDNRGLLGVYVVVGQRGGEVQRCQKFLAARLADRPVSIQWHRAYQTLLESAGDDAELVAQYQKYLEAEPENSALLYLRGRIEPDSALAIAFQEQAIAADPTNAYPWLAKGFQLRCQGDFAEALAASAEACRLNPPEETMRNQREDLQFATGDFAALEQELRQQLLPAPLMLPLQQRLLEVLVADGRADAAREACETYAQAVKTQDPQDAEQAALQLRLHLLYLLGDFEPMQNEAATLTDPARRQHAESRARFELGDFNALKSSDSGSSNDGFSHLCRGIGWSRKGDAVQADAARLDALAAFDNGSRDDRYIAGLLRKGAELQPADIVNLTIEPRLKAIVLLALAETCPAQQPELFALADKLSYNRDFPYHFLKRSLQKSQTSTEAEAPPEM